MRPKLILPEVFSDDERFVRDSATGVIWHRVFHRPLYADTDRSQVVYHANYLRYFELGRATLMRDTGYPYHRVEDDGYVYPVVDLGMNFHHPLFYDDPMWVHTRPGLLERVRVAFEYCITGSDYSVVHCSGHTTHCALNRERKPTSVDPGTIALWEGFPKP